MALEELAKLLTPSEDPAQENGEKEKGTSAYKDLSRQFNEDDLDNPVAKKFLLNELDRLRKESVEGEEYHVKFHKEELKSAVLEEKLGSAQSTNIMYGACISFGSLFIGLSKEGLSKSSESSFDYFSLLPLILGVLLIGAAILSRHYPRTSSK